MDIIITKGERQDRIEARRSDGSVASFRLPHKGPVPHDVVHYVVERAIGGDRGFWGLVAAGADPEEIGAMAKAAGHASAKRAQRPDPGFVTIIQIEPLVEAFEADQWGGGNDNDAVRAMAAAGCEQSLVAPVDISDAAINAARGAIADFHARWRDAAVGTNETLEWELPVRA
jgi:hypothetical protein